MKPQRSIGETVRTTEGIPGKIVAQCEWDVDNEEFTYDVAWHDGQVSKGVGDSFFLADDVEPDTL
jgi:hypothetical protein